MLLLLSCGAPLALANGDVCSENPSKGKCVASLEDEYAYYRSEVEYYWSVLMEEMGGQAAPKVQAARLAWFQALRRRCRMQDDRRPEDGKVMYCMTKGMHECLAELRDAAFRLSNEESLKKWPPCASR